LRPVRRPDRLSPLRAPLLGALLAGAAPLGAAGAQPGRAAAPTHNEPGSAWPEAKPGPGVDAARLNRALDFTFADTSLTPTRAVVVVHRGAIVAERYAPGFDRDSKFMSHSIAKFILGGVIGIAVRKGLLNVTAPADVPEWRARPGDRRGRITVEHLLHMSSGLRWNENYVDPLADLPAAMSGPGYRDEAAFVASYPLDHEPGTHYYYNSGATNLLSGVVRRAVGGDRASYLGFMRRELFDPLGIESAEPELDAAGTWIGSSWFWATARDYARLGQLYLQDGVWQGRRILPEGWVTYTRTPGPAPDNKDGYGALSQMHWPDRGSDAFGHRGYRGQALIIVPSRQLVIARFANILRDRYWPLLLDHLWEIVQAFEARETRP
jgi:CubicO group peptidase (beta-lactamase class C family)